MSPDRDFTWMDHDKKLIRTTSMKKALFIVEFPEHRESWKVAQRFPPSTTLDAAIQVVMQPVGYPRIWIDVSRYYRDLGTFLPITEARARTVRCINGERYRLRCSTKKPILRGWSLGIEKSESTPVHGQSSKMQLTHLRTDSSTKNLESRQGVLLRKSRSVDYTVMKPGKPTEFAEEGPFRVALSPITEEPPSKSPDEGYESRSGNCGFNPEMGNYDPIRHEFLQQCYDKETNPSNEMMREITTQLNLPLRGVEEWFASRRADKVGKERRKDKETCC
uniref:Homeobox domain-containing protein n=1 Tax=Steinernema glaseri TaxID=37863 RepID=A0A1I7Y5E2_9BILA